MVEIDTPDWAQRHQLGLVQILVFGMCEYSRDMEGGGTARAFVEGQTEGPIGT